MDNYKLKFEENNILKQNIQIPEVPFVISHRDGNNFYIVSKLDDSDKYVLMDAKGISYDNDYSKELMYKYLNDGMWILRESKIIISKS